MAAANFDYERAARALAQAAIEDDATAAKAEGITVRTLQRYRKRLQTDANLSQLVAHKKAVLEKAWAHKIAPAQRAALDFLTKAMRELNPADPDAVHSAAGALKIITECGLVNEVIRARLAPEDRPADRADRPGDTTTSHTALN
jgi:uncharacterized protein (DUF2384 family)